MSEPPIDIEDRLRAHLERVAGQPPRSGMAERIIANVDEPRPAPWHATLMVALVIVAAVTLLILMTAGHQSNNVFSNISNGLAQ